MPFAPVTNECRGCFLLVLLLSGARELSIRNRKLTPGCGPASAPVKQYVGIQDGRGGIVKTNATLLMLLIAGAASAQVGLPGHP